MPVGVLIFGGIALIILVIYLLNRFNIDLMNAEAALMITGISIIILFILIVGIYSFINPEHGNALFYKGARIFSEIIH